MEQLTLSLEGPQLLTEEPLPLDVVNDNEEEDIDEEGE